MNRYDVIVVGAGPAGASAAYFLSAGGARVLVAEQARLPRYKPCGGAVPRVTLEQFSCDFGDVVECRPREVIYCWQGGQSVTQDLAGRPLAMVMRERFDAQILNSTPADVRDGTPIRSAEENVNGVRVFTEAGDAIHADYLIVADGATSRLARTLGLRRRRLLDRSPSRQRLTPEARDLGAICRQGALRLWRAALWLSMGLRQAGASLCGYRVLPRQATCYCGRR